MGLLDILIDVSYDPESYEAEGGSAGSVWYKVIRVTPMAVREDNIIKSSNIVYWKPDASGSAVARMYSKTRMPENRAKNPADSFPASPRK